MSVIDTLPGIKRAALEIAYAAGGINRERSEADFYADLEKYFIDAAPAHPGLRHAVTSAWQDISAWLAAVPDDALSVICDGDEEDVAAAMVGAPRGADELLNDIFERVT